MSTSHRFTDRAQAEILEIYLFGIASFGPVQADRFIRGLESCFEMIVRQPRIGRLARSIGRDVRRHEHGSHVVLYREEGDHILILAVIHGSSMRGLKV